LSPAPSPLAPPTPLSLEDFAAIRAHPRFREAVEQHAAAHLARYAGLPLIERWMFSDLGRASLSAAAMVREGLPIGLTLGGLIESAAMTGVCSRGRVRHYVQTAIANGLMAPDEAGPIRPATRLTLTPRFHAALAGGMEVGVAAASILAPEAAPAVARLEGLPFRRRIAAFVGLTTLWRPDLFPTDRPINLFHARDGGSRMLDELIRRQRPGRAHLLEACALSRSALARASFCSRRHVVRLLSDGETLGLLRLEGGTMNASAVLSQDVERHFSVVFAMMRAAAVTALAAD
jgi:hypothetical protein